MRKLFAVHLPLVAKEHVAARGVGNERNLVHLVEKSVEIKLKS